MGSARQEPFSAHPIARQDCQSKKNHPTLVTFMISPRAIIIFVSYFAIALLKAAQSPNIIFIRHLFSISRSHFSTFSRFCAHKISKKHLSKCMNTQTSFTYIFRYRMAAAESFRKANFPSSAYDNPRFMRRLTLFLPSFEALFLRVCGAIVAAF